MRRSRQNQRSGTATSVGLKVGLWILTALPPPAAIPPRGTMLLTGASFPAVMISAVVCTTALTITLLAADNDPERKECFSCSAARPPWDCDKCGFKGTQP